MLSKRSGCYEIALYGDPSTSTSLESTVPAVKPSRVGPQPLTIEEYRRRNKKPVPAVKQTIINKRKRGGRIFKHRKELAETYQLLALSLNKGDKKKHKAKIVQLKKEEKLRKKNNRRQAKIAKRVPEQ